MKYTIQINYVTGDSYGSYNESRPIDLVWENLDIAKENLQRIKEHYHYYRDTNKDYSLCPDGAKEFGRYKSKKYFEDLKNIAKQRPWYDKGIERYDFCIVLKLDDESEYRYHTFWCGYFESLESAEIIFEPLEDTDLKITF